MAKSGPIPFFCRALAVPLSNNQYCRDDDNDDDVECVCLLAGCLSSGSLLSTRSGGHILSLYYPLWTATTNYLVDNSLLLK